MRFDAVVQTEDEGVFVEVPADSEHARARAPVTVTINGQSWESSVADYGGRFYLPLMRHPFCRYRYDLVPDRAFERYGLEQQAEIVRHSFMLKQGFRLVGRELSDLERLLPF